MLVRKPLDERTYVGLLACDVAARLCHHVFRQPGAACNVDGVAFAGNAHEQAVGGAQGTRVEFNGGVHAALVGIAVVFEDAVVRGNNHKGTPRNKHVERSHCDCAAFLRVGAASQFVQKDKAAAVGFVYHLRNFFHVGRERAQRFVDGLLVADVRKHGAEDGQTRAFFRGDGKARLVQQGKERDGLERNGFAAGVRPGDDEHLFAVHKADVNRHCLVAEQRVACPADGGRFECKVAVLCENPMHVGLPARRRTGCVQQQHGGVGCGKVFAPFAQPGGEFAENFPQLALVFEFQLDELVVCAYDFVRFDVDGLA